VKVVALCDRLSNALRLGRALAGTEGVDLVLLVSNNQRRRASVFGGILLADLILAGPAGWLQVARVARRRRLTVSTGHLEDPGLLEKIAGMHPDVGLHATGVIYRRGLIDLFAQGVLNPHIGLLPEYRGRSVLEWSVLNGDPTGITTFFVDEGIDTGPRIVCREPVPIPPGMRVPDAKSHLFGLDGVMFRAALTRLQDPGFEPILQEVSDGTRWYAMSHLFTGVVDRLLAIPDGQGS
jgi:hypothetical protein